MRNKVFKKMEAEIKLDLGCGNNPREGFTGIDSIKFDKVDEVVDLVERWRESEYGEAQKIGAHIGDFKKWPWKDNSVSEVHSSHFIEHLNTEERVLFFNELYRILIPGGRCQIITPHWASCRAYGDPTHKWPPISEFLFYYLKQEWREVNAPHTDIKYNPRGFDCDFEANWGYNIRADIGTRNQEYQMYAISNFKEVCQDTIATLIKK